ncbi:bifunctional lysylphosphatidylglycerol flippase/synthetase MprF [Streptomyces sp. NPDC060194]|uniref:bifunctional lysylphosphatidylglycerol flippase/synthetase MprF n=1 Tax=Streptomyces sp. NPDC060194 TaxID=3347069 RepID=UPI003667CFF5
MRAVRRLPFTTALTAVVVVVALASQSLWRPAEDRTWYPDVAYGLPSFEANRWWTIATGFFLGERPATYVPILFAVVLLVGVAEWRLGTRRAAAAVAAGHVLAVLAAAGVLWAARSHWAWAGAVAGDLDTGPSAGALAALALATATLPSPWRLRLRLGLCVYVLVFFLYVGGLADLEHLLGVALGLAAGRLLPVPGRTPSSGRVSRREWRLLAVAGLVLLLVISVVVWLVPGQGPMGDTYGIEGSWGHVAVQAVIVLLLVEGLRRGKRLAWWATVCLAVLAVLVAALVVAAYALADPADRRDVAEGLGVMVPSGIVWAVLLGVLLRGRTAFRAPTRLPFGRSRASSPDRERERAVALLTRHGGGTLSWMTTWPDNHYFFAPSGQAYVAYREHAGVGIALGDPVGAPQERAAAVAAFAAFVERSGSVPCLFSTSRSVALEADRLGWRSVQVAEDTVVPLGGLDLKGKRWQKVRTALNRGRKLEVRLDLVRLAEQPRPVLAQVRAISEEWVGDQGLPEMGFTLGGVEEALDPHVRVGLAMDEDDQVLGVTSWIPVYAGGDRVRGWTLDVMRRRSDGGFPPVVEFMIGSALLAFQEEGAEFVSLSGAPLARTEGGDAPELRPFDRILDQLGAFLEPYYGFRSLHAFKQKFNPVHEPMYLVYRDEADLPRIGAALTRAYMPDADTRELVRALRRPATP